MNRLLAAAFFTVLVTGCSIETLPSQSDPSCSWSSDVPASHDALCKTAFTTLRDVVNAVASGNTRKVHTLVPVPRIASKIISAGRAWKQHGVRGLHVVPSLTLSTSQHGYLGAGFFILGNEPGGTLKAPQTVYLQLHGSTARIVGDTFDQEW